MCQSQRDKCLCSCEATCNCTALSLRLASKCSSLQVSHVLSKLLLELLEVQEEAHLPVQRCCGAGCVPVATETCVRLGGITDLYLSAVAAMGYLRWHKVPQCGQLSQSVVISPHVSTEACLLALWLLGGDPAKTGLASV